MLQYSGTYFHSITTANPHAVSIHASGMMYPPIAAIAMTLGANFGSKAMAIIKASAATNPLSLMIANAIMPAGICPTLPWNANNHPLFTNATNASAIHTLPVYQ